MNRKYNPNSSMTRFAFLAAALLMTLSVGGFVDLLADPHTENSVHAKQVRPVITASR